MTTHRIYSCSNCPKKDKQRNLKRIRGLWYCSSCAIKIRQNHRKETESQLIPFRMIKAPASKIKINPEIVYPKPSNQQPPIIKGSSLPKQKVKSYCFMTFDEKKFLLSSLIRSGLSYDEAKERLNEVIEQQRKVQKMLRDQNKSEKEISIRLSKDKAKLLEGLR